MIRKTISLLFIGAIIITLSGCDTLNQSRELVWSNYAGDPGFVIKIKDEDIHDKGFIKVWNPEP